MNIYAAAILTAMAANVSPDYCFPLVQLMQTVIDDHHQQPQLIPVRSPNSSITPAVSSAPIPINNPLEWVTTDDYPPAALAERRVGTTSFRLTIGPDGTVTDCQITGSSGSEDLDNKTCSLILQRARFKAAKHKTIGAISGNYSSRVRWEIPNTPIAPSGKIPIPTTTDLTQTFTIMPDGTAVNCSVSGASSNIGNTACAAGLTFQPYYNAAGQKVPVRITSSIMIKVEELDEKPVSASQ
jgi:TonB family protein